jgi:ribonuclease HI/quercetin dioxygenase-like cupin family protein
LVDTWHIAHADGGSRGNPGPAAIGAVLLAPDGRVLEEVSERIGRATNNVAEYRAVIAALEAAARHRVPALLLRLDSELIVRQLSGRYRVRNADLLPLHERARSLIAALPRVRVEHVPREQNRHADRLVNRALDDKAPGKPPSPTKTAPLLVDLPTLLHEAGRSGAVWSHGQGDLNLSLVRFREGEGVAAHRNDEVDVLIVALSGSGIIEVDGRSFPLAAGEACLIPKGTERAIRGDGGTFGYLSCHRRRGPLLPSTAPAPDSLPTSTPHGRRPRRPPS